MVEGEIGCMVWCGAWIGVVWSGLVHDVVRGVVWGMVWVCVPWYGYCVLVMGYKRGRRLEGGGILSPSDLYDLVYKDTLLTKSRSVNRLLFCHVCHSASSTWTEAQHCLFVRSSTNLIIIQSALDQ